MTSTELLLLQPQFSLGYTSLLSGEVCLLALKPSRTFFQRSMRSSIGPNILSIISIVEEAHLRCRKNYWIQGYRPGVRKSTFYACSSHLFLIYYVQLHIVVAMPPLHIDQDRIEQWRYPTGIIAHIIVSNQLWCQYLIEVVTMRHSWTHGIHSPVLRFISTTTGVDPWDQRHSSITEAVHERDAY